MPKRIGVEAKIIALFTALPEDSKRIVMDLLKSQTATPRKVASPKSSAPSVGKKSSRRSETAASTVSFGDDTGNAGGASEARAASGLLPDNPEDFHKAATA